MKNESTAALRRLSADPFRPHSFKTLWRPLEAVVEPKILITPDAYADMLAIAENAGADEIGWLGTVTELGSGRYLIDGIYMPAQDVHGATCELNEDGLGELFTELAMADEDACSRMHFWGHVHPSNDTTPSPQDEAQMRSFDHNPWFIRGIFGRHGRAEFTFFDYKRGVRFNDVSWSIHVEPDEGRREKWAAQVAEKVKKIIAPPYPLSFLSGEYPGFDEVEQETGRHFGDRKHKKNWR